MNTDHLLDAIGQIDDRFVEEAGESVPRRRPHVLRRFAVVAAAAVLCVLLGVSALAAADVGNAYDLLYSVSPAVAQSLKPVRMSCEDNGIIMEVGAASVEASRAQMLIVLQDVKGDRVDETTDLFDSYSIRRPFNSSATCEMVGYEEETRSAVFLITIDRMDDNEIRAGKVTFGATRFLSGKQYTDMTRKLSVPESVPALMADPQLRGASGTDTEQPVFLMPEPDNSFSPVEGVQITAIGFVNGKLHAQAHYDDILNTDNHGFLYLRDEQGEIIECASAYSAWDETHSGSYEEYVFDVERGKTDGYLLCGSFTTCNAPVEGNWQVTFPLREGQIISEERNTAYILTA